MINDYEKWLEMLTGGNYNNVIIIPRCCGKRAFLSYYMEKLISYGIIDSSKVITVKHLPCNKDLPDSFIPPMTIKSIEKYYFIPYWKDLNITQKLSIKLHLLDE